MRRGSVDWVEVAAALIVILVLTGIFAFVAWPNYNECRDAGFSVRYCAFSHLIR
jgi:hypothetical protein